LRQQKQEEEEEEEDLVGINRRKES